MAVYVLNWNYIAMIKPGSSEQWSDALLNGITGALALEQRIYSSVGKSISPVFIGAEDI